MSCKSRVQAALDFQSTPYVPYTFGFTSPVAARLSQHYGVEEPFVALGMHVFAVGPRPAAGFEPRAEGVDEFGVSWHTTPFGARLPVRHPLPEPTLRGYAWPEARAPGRFDHVGQTMAANRDRFLVAVVDHTLFERAWFLRGFEEFLLDLALRPAFAHALLDRVLEFDLAILDALLAFPVDGVWFGDDYAHQGGLIMSPRMWRKFIKPRLAILFERARQQGLPTFLHSDGAVAELIPDLLEVGLNVLNPLQPEVMDLARLKRKYGRDLCLCGGISTQRVLSQGTPDEVESELRQWVGVLAQGGGYIVATAGSVQADVPLANLVRLIDLLRGQDGQPLNVRTKPGQAYAL